MRAIQANQFGRTAAKAGVPEWPTVADMATKTRVPDRSAAGNSVSFPTAPDGQVGAHAGCTANGQLAQTGETRRPASAWPQLGNG